MVAYTEKDGIETGFITTSLQNEWTPKDSVYYVGIVSTETKSVVEPVRCSLN